jgi:hypothetical protein
VLAELDDPLKWLFDMFMLYRHLKPIEEKNYHRRLPDMVWQFVWSAVAIMVSASMMAESLTKQGL